MTHGLMERALEGLQHSVEQIRQLPALEAMSVHFDSNRMYSGPAAEFLASRTEMNVRIGDVAASASTSVLTAQPGRPTDRDPKVVELGAQRTIDALQSGVEVRSLYNPLAAVHEQTCGYVEQIVDAGAEVSTLGGVFPRMMIIDDRHLFIDNCLMPSAPSDAGWHVTDRSAVTWVITVFDCLWDRATRWEDMSKGRERLPVTTVRQRQILRDLESGYSVQQAARRIDLASRTVTKELSALREELGLRTLYQVVAWWVQSPDRELH
ncbi:LuxR C-terminal-related transcriptional regulator [Streptomyces luteolus]|uniref:LuxR C-terminal-related transcriptional regulator n=1 Tax=Streptomyces luteolus TaxID=3043615 RepID=A0ABT6SXF6_9ACTN|nr:LuxR C-terminal-related transcriptional regulator [Streptomyces sp. B-S-A12]MDI3419890.1 LuxR C-terminal-related transcriptional regulator [Streptomyces sp. B-S-A12]